MKTKISFFVACLWLLSHPCAQAFYNESTGRWLSRDPVDEPGFQKTTSVPKNLGKRSLEYQFVVNSPISKWDYLGLDDPGCDLPGWIVPGWNRDCFLRCCAAHDMCYYNQRIRNGRPCSAGSWLQLFSPCSPCGRCNRQVVGCFLGCLLGVDTNPGPMWFCSNGPSANTVYFNWDEIPASCWEDGVKPSAP